jgi:hypothetical protein
VQPALFKMNWMPSTTSRENNDEKACDHVRPKSELFPETARDFFLKVVDTQFTFEVDAQCRATAVIQHMNGKDQRAPRIE